MERMFLETRLSECLTDSFLEEVRRSRHYEPEDRKLLAGVAADMAVCLRRQECAYLAKKKDGSVVVCMTLGGGVDLLQERYGRTGRLLESYMVEHIACALLSRGYEEIFAWIHGHMGGYVKTCHFFGGEDGYPLEGIREALSLVGDCRIRCSEAFCLTPSKSTVFLAELSATAPDRAPAPCLACGRRSYCEQKK